MSQLMDVFECDDYKIENDILTIYNPLLVGKVRTLDQFNEFTQGKYYNAMICPDLFNIRNPFNYVECRYTKTNIIR